MFCFVKFLFLLQHYISVVVSTLNYPFFFSNPQRGLDLVTYKQDAILYFSTQKKNTALLKASLEDRADVMPFLLDAGADIEARNTVSIYNAFSNYCIYIFTKTDYLKMYLQWHFFLNFYFVFH